MSEISDVARQLHQVDEDYRGVLEMIHYELRREDHECWSRRRALRPLVVKANILWDRLVDHRITLMRLKAEAYDHETA